MKSMSLQANSKHAARSLFALLLGATCLIVVRPVHADDDAERERLAKISYELQQVRQMIDDANRTADKTARVRFRYDWLSRDVELMQRGIDDHLDAPRQPRPVSPLRGDYRN